MNKNEQKCPKLSQNAQFRRIIVRTDLFLYLMIQVCPYIFEDEVDGSETKTSGYLMGDEGYGISPFVQTPFSGFIIR